MNNLLEKRIIICGGGTAGHIYPAVAVIEYIKRKYPDCKILFIGTKKGMENSFIPALDIDFKTIKASGLVATNNPVKKFSSYIKFSYSLIAGFFSSVKMIIKFKPDSILGMGGYVCGPVLLAAVFLNKKYVLHEQNLIPGRLNRIFSKFSTYIFISFEETKKYFDGKLEKIIFSGNPVRESIKNSRHQIHDYKKWGLGSKRFTIVAFGGSLGADKINNTVIDLYDYFRFNNNIQILLICGLRYFEDTNKKIADTFKISDALIFKIFPYINEMDEVYTIADLIISRAGAITIAELIVTNIPAILIPYPEAIENHQFYNANFLVKNNKAVMILDKDLNESILIKSIEDLLSNNKEKYNSIKEKRLEFRKLNGEEIIAETMLGVVN
jgi:UDP-N-acetylglucosamine--N-acetylmuramyl-(pentapeptide) pyrophosphoryl-undecaprenol N-acetylglucosamine transferase